MSNTEKQKKSDDMYTPQSVESGYWDGLIAKAWRDQGFSQELHDDFMQECRMAVFIALPKCRIQKEYAAKSLIYMVAKNAAIGFMRKWGGDTRRSPVKLKFQDDKDDVAKNAIEDESTITEKIAVDRLDVSWIVNHIKYKAETDIKYKAFYCRIVLAMTEKEVMKVIGKDRSTCRRYVCKVRRELKDKCLLVMEG